MNKFNLIFSIFLSSVSFNLKLALAEPNEPTFKCSSNGPVNCDAVTDLGHSVIVRNPRLVHGGEELKFSSRSSHLKVNFQYFLAQHGYMICKLNGFTNGEIIQFDEPPFWDKVTAKKIVELGISSSGQIEVYNISHDEFLPVRIVVTELKCIK